MAAKRLSKRKAMPHVETLASDVPPALRFQPSKAYLEKTNNNKINITSNTSPLIPATLPSTSTSNSTTTTSASATLTFEQRQDAYRRKIKTESFSNPLNTISTPESHPKFNRAQSNDNPHLTEAAAQLTHNIVVKSEPVVDDLQSDANQSRNYASSHSPIYPPDQKPEPQDYDNSYDSDVDSIHSAGVIQAQLVGTRSREYSEEDMDISEEEMDISEEEMDISDGEELYNSLYEQVTREVEELADNDVRYKVELLEEATNPLTFDDSLLVSHLAESEPSHKMSREFSQSSLNIDLDQEEEDDNQEEEEGEIREEPISRRSSSSILQPKPHIEQTSRHTYFNDTSPYRSISEISLPESNTVNSTSNARYSTARQLESQDSLFDNRSKRFPSHSSHSQSSESISNRLSFSNHNNLTSLPNSQSQSSLADLSDTESLASTSKVTLDIVPSTEVANPLVKASYSRPGEASVTGSIVSDAKNASVIDDSSTNSEKAAYIRRPTLSTSALPQPQLPPPIEPSPIIKSSKQVTKDELPMSQSDKFKSLPLKLHQVFPDIFTAESATSPLIFAQPFRSSDAPTYIPDETILHGFWPAPPTLSSGKGIFPLPALTPTQIANEEDTRGRVDIFIDNSNVLYSFLNWVRNRPESSVSTSSTNGNSDNRIKPAKTVTLMGKKVKMDYKVLFGILERGRKVEKRVLVGSSPLWQSLETATKWGYEVSILQRVSRPLAPPVITRPSVSRAHLSATSSDASIDRRFIPKNATVLPPAPILPPPSSNIPAFPTIPRVEDDEEALIVSEQPATSLNSTSFKSIGNNSTFPSLLEIIQPPTDSTPPPAAQPRFTPKGAILPPLVPIIDPITGIATTPVIELARKRTRGIKKSRAVKAALLTAALTRTSSAGDVHSLIASGSNAIGPESLDHASEEASKLHIDGVKRRLVVHSPRPFQDQPILLPQQQPSHSYSQPNQQQQHQQQQRQIQEVQQRQRQQQEEQQAAMSGMIVPQHFKEQAVDELLHFKILESLLDYTPLPSIPRPLLVLVTGDANSSEYNPTGFLGCMKRALDRGWNVEIIAFPDGTSSSWLVEELNNNTGMDIEEVLEEGKLWTGRGRLSVVDLSVFAPELVSI